MSGVFRNIDPPPPHRPASVTPPPPVFGAGGGHTRWVEREWGSIVRKTPDTALYTIYVSTLWLGFSWHPILCFTAWDSLAGQEKKSEIFSNKHMEVHILLTRKNRQWYLARQRFISVLFLVI